MSAAAKPGSIRLPSVFFICNLRGGSGLAQAVGSQSWHRKSSSSFSHAPSPSDTLNLPAELQVIFEQDYARFSDAEYARRHAALADVMERAEVDHLLIVTAQNVGNATRWVTGWPGTIEALTVFRPGEPMTMFVEYYNHLPQARMLARGVEVRWGEEKGIAKAAEELSRRGARRVGVIGPLAGPKWNALEASCALLSLDAQYIALRMDKSEEEIAWLRIGAALSDAGMAALITGTRPGMSEHELGNVVERAYVGLGGSTVGSQSSACITARMAGSSRSMTTFYAPPAMA
jgi:Xaa-Pro aminopeptidase